MKNQEKPIHPAAKQNQFGQMEIMPGITKFEYAVIHIVANGQNNPQTESARKHWVKKGIELAKEIFLQLEENEKQEGN